MTAISSEERYRRLDLLGRGGMGEVFLADDLLLRRKVAIKVVHRSASSNPRAEKLLRREAKAAAALDNPFICKVYEVGESNGRVFIAMEYVQGETLRQRLQRGEIPIREAINLGREIADGLEEAARQRIVHRDLKPTNIIITAQNRVKIMDFGLAKRLPGDDSVDESSAFTPDGMVVGTREYMSPEQLRGKPLEPSSDLFAFGLILYEVLTGEHPFKKGSALDTQFAILNEKAPDPALKRPDIPDDLSDLVERLLGKNAADRPRIAEIRERLGRISEAVPPEGKERTLGLSASASVEGFVARKPRVALAVGFVLLLLVTGLSLFLGLRPEPRVPQARMTTLVTWPSNEEHASLAPDSKSVTFISNRDGVKNIWLMDLSGGEPRSITSGPGNLTAQMFSEDGQEIAYTLESDAEKLLQTIRVDGGPPTRSLALPKDLRVRRLIRWAGTNVYLETNRLELLRMSLLTGELSPVTTLPREAMGPFSFDVSKDAGKVVFGARHPDGSTSLWAQPSGQAARSLTGPGFRDGSPFFTDAAGDGRLFFESNRSGQEDLWVLERPGREPRQITFGSNREFIESVSEDAATIVFSEVLEGASLFTFDLRTGNRSQLTAENKRDVTPSGSRSGALAFARVSLSSETPWSQSAVLWGSPSEGRFDTRVLLRDGWNPSLSPDGEWLSYQVLAGTPPTPRLHLINTATAHSREIAELPLVSRQFMVFPWYFSQRNVHWSARNELWFVQRSVEGASKILHLDPRSGPAREIATLDRGAVASTLVSSPDGLRLFYVRATEGKPGAVVHEISGSRDTPRHTEASGALSLLGFSGQALIMAHIPQAGVDRAAILSMEGTKVLRLFELEGRPSSLRLIGPERSLTFSRRDGREIENVFLIRMDTRIETMLTANGIQGVAFSPVSLLGSHTLVFSQQLRNKDLGIIRLDQP